MSPRQSKSRSRSGSRARGGKSTGRSSSHSRSLSASRRAASNTRRAASARRSPSSRRGSQSGREMSARSKRSRRADSSASYALKLLQQDHHAVAEALEEFESAGRDEKQAIARRICKMLTVHAQIEEELLYPAARDALDGDDAHLIAEARVEHASIKDLVGQIEDREQLDEQYEAKVCVLGEYVKHHVSEEENEIFPRLGRTSLDLQALGERLEERKRELMGEEGESAHDGQGMRDREEEESMSGGGMAGSRSRGGRGHRSTGLHARRH